MKRFLTAMAVATWLALGSAAQASSMDGPTAHVDRVKANTTDVYTMFFYGGQMAQVRVHGYGTTVLRLEIYDDNGYLIDTDDDKSGGDSVITWVPRYSGSFKVRVVNRSPISNPYWISSN